MPHQTGDMPLSLMGFVIYGDLADLTLYRNKNGKVVSFQKTWPDKPPSYLQILDQTRFAVAAHAWVDLPEIQKEQWRLAARRASLCLTGYNLYMYCWLAPHNESLVAIARQTGTTLTCTCGVYP